MATPPNSEVLYDELVNLCYESALDNNAWYSLLMLLTRCTGYQQAALMFWDQSHQATAHSTSIKLGDLALDTAYAQYSMIDPANSWVAKRPVGIWYHDTQELGLQQIQRNTFYQEYFRPFNINTISVLKIYEAAKAGIYLSLLSQLDTPQPSPEQRRLLQRLTPHLVRAGRIANQLSDLQQQAQQHQSLLDQQRHALWLTDARGQVQYCNEAAQHFLRQPEALLYLEHHQLCCRLQDGMLQTLISQAAGKWGARQAGLLLLNPHTRQQVLVIPVQEQAHPKVFPALPPRLPAVLILLLTPKPNIALFEHLFRLTPAECRLAELLTLGNSLESSAEQLGVTLHTVRTQVRSLFSKTRTERQSDLVSLLIRLSVY